MKKRPRSYTVFLGGEQFSLQHLIGNAWLAEAIYERSHGRLRCVLPQDFTELQGRSRRAVRDGNLEALVGSDLALFNVGFSDPAAGTAVEFMYAKCADIPCVLLRTEGRPTGDARAEPWSLMADYFPRTANVTLPTLAGYRAALDRRRPRIEHALHLAGQHSSAAVQRVCEDVAAQCVRAFDRLIASEPVMPRHLREEAYQWLPLLCSLRGKGKERRKQFERFLEHKVERDLL